MVIFKNTSVNVFEPLQYWGNFDCSTLKRMNTTQHNLLNLMLNACETMHIPQWEVIKPHAEHEFEGLLIKLNWIMEMKQQQEMNTEQARIHIDIQKNTMRTRLMALPSLSMLEAEHLINTAIDSVRQKIYEETDWIII